jgi:hypothetical protein
MTTETETTAREQIGALLIDRAAAITARDARRSVAHYAPEFVSGSANWRASPGTALTLNGARSASRTPNHAMQTALSHSPPRSFPNFVNTSRATPHLTALASSL